MTFQITLDDEYVMQTPIDKLERTIARECFMQVVRLIDEKKQQ